MTWLTILPYLLSVWTLCAMWLAGSNPRHGWYLALAGQVLWFAYTWASGAWGFLPLNAGLTLVYTRNLMRASIRPNGQDFRLAAERYIRIVDEYAKGLGEFPEMRRTFTNLQAELLGQPLSVWTPHADENCTINGLREQVRRIRVRNIPAARNEYPTNRDKP